MVLSLMRKCTATRCCFATVAAATYALLCAGASCTARAVVCTTRQCWTHTASMLSSASTAHQFTRGRGQHRGNASQLPRLLLLLLQCMQLLHTNAAQCCLACLCCCWRECSCCCWLPAQQFVNLLLNASLGCWVCCCFLLAQKLEQFLLDLNLCCKLLLGCKLRSCCCMLCWCCLSNFRQ